MLLAVTSCTSNPEPAPLPTEGVSSTTTATPTPTPTAPTMPAEAQGTSKAAAKAFVRHYFEAINHATATGDTAYLEGLGTNECESCSAIAGNISDIYSAGGSIESEGWLVRSVSAVPLQSAREPVFDVAVFMTTEKVVTRSGALPQSFDGGKQPMTIHLVRRNDGWAVTRLDKIA